MVNDYLIDATTGQLQIANGDLVLGDATKVMLADNILMCPGDLKEVPQHGVGMVQYINDDVAVGEFKGRVSQVLRDDGAKINLIAGYDYQSINIDAEY